MFGCFDLARQLAVVAAQHEDLVLEDRAGRGRAGDRPRHRGEATPFLAQREGVAVGKVFALDALGARAQGDAAEQVEGVLRAGGLREHAARAGAEREFLPAGVEVGEVDREGAGGGRGGVRAFGAAGDDHLAADERAGRVGQRTRQEREGADLEFAVLHGERVAVGVMAMRVGAADHEQALADRDADAVAARTGQPADRRPFLGARAGERVDFVVPDLGAAFPGRLIGVVGAAAAEQEVAGRAHEGSAEAGGVGSFRKSGPAHGNGH